MTITLTPKPDVADPGPITLTLTDARSSFVAGPADCSAVDDERVGPGHLRGPTIAGLGLNITAVQPEGPLPLTVTDAGHRTVTLNDSSG